MSALYFTDEAFTDETTARNYCEEIRWPQGVLCPHCGAAGARKLPSHRYQCNVCRGQFSVTVGTIFQDSKAPLHKWLRAIYLIASSDRGVTAVELQRDPGFGSYRTAWALCHRIRWAMQQPPLAGLIRRAGEAADISARRPLRLPIPWDQALGAFLAVKLQTRDSIKSDRKNGAKMERRPIRR